MKLEEGEQSPSFSYKPVQFICSVNVTDQVILDNIGVNAKRELPAVQLRKAVVCGGGPSLIDHLDEIMEKQGRGFHVYALNNTAKFLRSHGIQPTAQFIIDARPENLEFLTPTDPNVTYFLGAQVDPSLFDAVATHGKVYKVYIGAVEGAVELISELVPGSTVLASASTAGLQALNLLDVLGYRVVDLYGYDSCNRDGQHHAYDQALNEDQKIHDFQFRGKSYFASGPMASQAEQFIQFYRKYVTRGMVLKVFGEGLLPDMWRFNEMRWEICNTDEQREIIKYEKIWTLPHYRLRSRGADSVELAIEKLGMTVPAKVVDFGCGPGRATLKFKEKGFDVLGIDFASNALETDVPFLKATLWKLPHLPPAEYGFCCEVMEHIPTEYVMETLQNIRSVVPQAFFTIAFKADVHGAAIGEVLHLTVRPAEWWTEKLKEHWPVVEHLGDGAFICKQEK